MARLALPSVTLVAATSINVAATVAALDRCLEVADFGDRILFTDSEPAMSSAIRRVTVPAMRSVAAYSDFMIRELIHHVRTDHVLIVQWDGFILNARAWDANFLDYDYIGAPWPQFTDGYDVGNGGFSLRSRRLLEACSDPLFDFVGVEDVAIARNNRRRLEDRHGIRFADRATAARFSFERMVPRQPTFGFHGIFNLPDVLGLDEFWALYRNLDERTMTPRDIRLLFKRLGLGEQPLRRQARFAFENYRRWF